MGTNELGPNTVNISVNMPTEMHAALKNLAAKSGMRLGAYCRAVISAAIQTRTVYRTVTVQEIEAGHALNDGISSAPAPSVAQMAADISGRTATAVTQYNRSKRGTKSRRPAGAKTPPGSSDRAGTSTKLGSSNS